jgi:hypothetical protein
MKATLIWDEEGYVWPVGTGIDDDGVPLDGKKVDGEQMKIMGRVKEDDGEYVQIDADPTDADIDLGLPNASQYEIEFPVPRGKTLQIVLIPIYQGVEGEASDPVEMFNPLLVPPKPAGVVIIR